MASMNAQALVDAGFERLAVNDSAAASRLAQQVLAARKQFAPALHLLACCQLKSGDVANGAATLRQAVAQKPDHLRYRIDLAAALIQNGAASEALEHCRRVVELDPRSAEAHSRLGIALIFLQRSAEAVEQFERAFALAPDNESAFTSYGIALRGSGRLWDALTHQLKTLQSHPSTARSDAFIGNLLLDVGDAEKAVPFLRRAVAAPDALGVFRADYLFALAHAEVDRQKLFAEHRRILSCFDRPLENMAWPNPPDASRRLRVAYLSSDFRDHPIASFIEPILANHDPQQMEIICYSAVRQSDEITRRLAGLASRWIDVAQQNAVELIEQIRSDQVDVLIDLSLLTNGGRRLHVLAAKPAPVIINYLAYAVSSGMQAVDWRISDAHIDPPDAPDEPGCERVFRLPQTQWCYRPPSSAPDVSPLPARRNGSITFGSTARLMKLTSSMLGTWCRVLRESPGSRLRFQSSVFSDASLAADYRQKFADLGIEPQRVDLLGSTDLRTYLAGFAEIDVMLDTYPFAGGTTTCNALWMGVPVVAYAGQTPVSRVALSVLSNVGRSEWVATDADRFVQIAAELAGDLDRLEQIRSELRDQMRSSPLCDEAGFTRDLESAYRTMWADWCRLPLSRTRGRGQG